MLVGLTFKPKKPRHTTNTLPKPPIPNTPFLPPAKLGHPEKHDDYKLGVVIDSL